FLPAAATARLLDTLRRHDHGHTGRGRSNASGARHAGLTPSRPSSTLFVPVAVPTPKAAMDGPAAASSVPANRPGWTQLRRVVGLAAALVAILGYDAVGRKYYQGYAIPQGYGMDLLLPAELAQTAMFLAFGGLAMLGLAAALAGSGVIEGAVGAVRKAAQRLGGLAGLTAVWIFVASFSVSRFVMGHAVITDDEHVYRFIAQTLRTGSLTAPSPREDLAFFQEQFVVLDEHVRYGKYPIGHPLLLAAGQA